MYSQTFQQNKSVNPRVRNSTYQLGLDAINTRPISFYLYVIFLVSFFLHMPARIQFLADIRFDLILMLGTLFFVVVDKAPKGEEPDNISKNLYILLAYIIISIPFVKWPGSVIKVNLLFYIRAVCFFFFTVNVIRSEKDLKIFMAVFVLCQVFRVFEPVWLHITTGYWGSATSMNKYGTIVLDRLSGGPYDIINPNGLAWVIVSAIPFMFFLTRHNSFMLRLLYYVSFAIFIYALELSESRSGMVGIAVVTGGMIWKSKNKIMWILISSVAAAVIFFSLGELSQERYLSIYRTDVKGARTAKLRVDGWISGIKAVWDKPIVGHGIGTSPEVGVNLSGTGIIAHNLYIEILQEIGIIGFIIFFKYVKSMIESFFIVKKRLLSSSLRDNFLIGMVDAMQVWMTLALIFGMASYGLGEHTWYFFGGICVVLLRLTEKRGEGTPENVLNTKN